MNKHKRHILWIFMENLTQVLDIEIRLHAVRGNKERQGKSTVRIRLESF